MVDETREAVVESTATATATAAAVKVLRVCQVLVPAMVPRRLEQRGCVYFWLSR